MNFLFLNIALGGTLLYYVWVLNKIKSIRLLFILILTIAALPDITSLFDRQEALTFSVGILLFTAFLSLIKLPLALENLQVRVLSRLLSVSLFMTMCSVAFALYNMHYHQYYYEYIQVGILVLFSVIGFFVFIKALK